MDRSARAVGAAAIVALAALAMTGAAVGLSGGDQPSSRAADVPAAPEAGAAETSRPASPSGPPLLRPNMRSLDASDLQIEVADGVRRLRFAASLANTGPGPLLVVPREQSDCPSGQRGADQLLHEDEDGDGEFQRGSDSVAQRRVAGCMLDHPTHDHWHFDAMAAYSLRRPATDEILVSRDKVSFCLRDNEQVEGQPVVVPREYFGDCTRNGPQGISPGWVDIYTADLDGQWLRLPPGVQSETLCLDLEADPLGLLLETEEADNATSVGVEIDGQQVRRTSDATCA